MDVLEARVHELELQLDELRGRRTATTTTARTPSLAPLPQPTGVPSDRPRAAVRPAPPRRDPVTLEDALSPRNLAIAGAVAVLAGLVFLVSYGISNGWISEEARVIGAMIFAMALALGGIYLRESKKLEAPAETLVVIGLAGLFISLVAATRLYDLIGPVPALAFSALIGASGLAVGLWWRNEVIATSILGAALMAPLMVGADYSPGLLVFLVPVFAAAVVASVERDWKLIFPISAILFLGSLLAAVSDAEQGSTVAAFGLSLLTLLLVCAGTLGRIFRKDLEPTEADVFVFGLFFTVVTALGTFLVTGAERQLVECEIGSGCSSNLTTGAALWLLTGAVVAGGIWWAAKVRGKKSLAVTAFALGSASLAAALGFIFDGGPLLTLAWSVESAVLIGLGRSRWQRMVGIGVLTPALVSALIQVPPETLGEGSASLVRDLVVLAPVLVPLAFLAWRERNELGEVASGFGVVLAAYMGLIACGTLTEPDHVLNLLPLCLAAVVPICFVDRAWSVATLAGFGAIASVFTVATAIPFDALVNGVPSVPEAVAAAGMLIASALAVAFRGPEHLRQGALWGSIGLAIYMVSALIVNAFQGGTDIDGELSREAQGQVIVSSLWALAGLGLVVAGLVRRHMNWRKAGLILLILSTVKISLYDLASLGTAGRTISFILVGLVLLAAAFAYQWMNRRAELAAATEEA